MQYSPKDLFWSVTFACGGVASLCTWLGTDYWEHEIPQEFVIPLYVLAHLLTGALFGAAWGKLAHRTLFFGLVGVGLYFTLGVLVFFAILWMIGKAFR